MDRVAAIAGGLSAWRCQARSDFVVGAPTSAADRSKTNAVRGSISRPPN